MPKKILKSILSTFVLIILCGIVYAESTPPVTTVTKDPEDPDGNSEWYVSPVELTLTSTDLGSGVKEINYRLNEGTWQKVSFENTLNLAPNASFENTESGETGIRYWDATVSDESSNYFQDTGNYAPGFSDSSAKIESSGSGWHGINHKDEFAVTTPFNNMNVSLWMKTESVSSSAYFKVYAVNSSLSQTLIYQGSGLSGTTGWTNLSASFVVNTGDAIGVFVDVGLDGSGNVWVDAISINESINSAETQLTIARDGEYTLHYYSVDRSGNTESTKTTDINLDQTPPGEWHDTQIIMGPWSDGTTLYVVTTIEDITSGISMSTDRYQYKVDEQSGYGVYKNLTSCLSKWLSGEWASLVSPPTSDGKKTMTLSTHKTSFCNDNWAQCKYVRFYAEDVAGNHGTKDYCINGAWIKVRGEGAVKANEGINMNAESDEDSTDGLIEVGTSVVEFFTSTEDWIFRYAPISEDYDYDFFWDAVTDKEEITGLNTDSGVFSHDGNLEIGSLPGDYDSDEFSQVIFVDGNLKVSTNIVIDDESVVLFIVNGDVSIDKTVTDVEVAIFADDSFYTAYDIEEGESTETLNLKGVYSADEFVLQRTLLDNTEGPSEDITFEPKYILKLNEYIGENQIQWQEIK